MATLIEERFDVCDCVLTEEQEERARQLSAESLVCDLLLRG
jgi:hypothetical protein